MQRLQHVRQMAAYNAWMNSRLYAAAANLDDQALSAERGAFFGSILGTLNHLVVADRIWLNRFSSLPACSEVLAPIAAIAQPTSLSQCMASDIRELSTLRESLDRLLLQFAESLDDATLDQALAYRNSQGVAANKNVFAVLMHLFNHQTHHRGQASTLLTQAGVDIGVTDLIARIADV